MTQLGAVCPTWPCPYCILGLEHNATFDDARSKWLALDMGSDGPPHNRFQSDIRRLAFEWLRECFTKGIPPAQAGRPPAPESSNRQCSAASASASSSTPTMAQLGQVGVCPLPFQPAYGGAQQRPMDDAGADLGVIVSRPHLGAEDIDMSTAQASVGEVTTQAQGEQWPQFQWNSANQTSPWPRWVRYDSNNEELIRSAFLSASEWAEIMVEYHHDMYYYRIDLTNMEQVNHDTQYRRPIRIVHRHE